MNTSFSTTITDFDDKLPSLAKKYYFDADRGEDLVEIKSGSDPRLTDIDDLDQMIQMLYIYSHKVQPPEVLAHHYLAVLETSTWWWSVEKNHHGIVIQRSKNLENVKDRYERKERPKPIKFRSSAKSSVTIRELIDLIWTNHDTNKEYDYLDSNCKQFTEIIYFKLSQKSQRSCSIS